MMQVYRLETSSCTTDGAEERYERHDEFIAGYRAAHKRAKELVKHNRAGHHCVVVIRGPLPSMRAKPVFG